MEKEKEDELRWEAILRASEKLIDTSSKAEKHIELSLNALKRLTSCPGFTHLKLKSSVGSFGFNKVALNKILKAMRQCTVTKLECNSDGMLLEYRTDSGKGHYKLRNDPCSSSLLRKELTVDFDTEVMHHRADELMGAD